MDQIYEAERHAPPDTDAVVAALEMAIPVVVTDACGRILRANGAFCRTTGYAQGELIGRTPAVLKSGRHDAAFYGRMWAELLETGLWRGDIWNRSKSGDLYLQDLTISAVRTADGGISHFVGVVRELDRKLGAASQLVHGLMGRRGDRPAASGGHYLEAELYELVAADRSVFDFIEQAALDGLWYWDLENPDQEWTSPRFWEVLGFDPGLRPHDSDAWQALIDPRDREAARENLRRHLDDPGQPYDQIVRCRHADGSTVWVRCRGQAIREPGGRPVRMLGAHTDLTALMRAQEELRAAREREAGILASLGEGVYGVDLNGICTFVNPAAASILQFSTDELIGTDQHALFHDHHADGSPYGKEDCPVSLVLRSGRRWEGEDWFIRKDRSGFPVWLVVTPLETDGRVTGAVVAFRDLSGQKAAEEALVRQKRRLESLIEGTGAGTWEWNVQTGEVAVNDRWAAVLGETVEGLAPISIATLRSRIHPDDRTESEDRLRAHLAGLTDAYDCELRMRHRDGHWIWVQDRGRVVRRTDDGAPSWVAGTQLDITTAVGARRAAAEREERYRLAQTATGVTLWDWDIAADAITWDAGLWHLLGYHEVDRVLTYAGWTALLHPADAGRAQAEVQRQLTDGGDFVVDFRYLTAAGDGFWIQGRGQVVSRDAEGRPLRMVGTHTPIHEAKMAQLQVEEFAQRLGFLANHVPGVLFQYRLHPDGRSCFPYASGGLAEIFGCDPGDVARDAAPVFRAVHPDDLDRITAAIGESARTLGPWREEYRVRHPRKGEIWVEGHATPEALPDGGIQWHGYITDITERRVYQDHLKARERRLRELFDAIPDPVLLIDPDTGRASHFNSATCAQLGYDAEEFATLGVFDYECLEAADETRDHIRRVMEEGGDGFETRHRRKDGGILDVRVTVRRVDLYDRPKILAVYHDISGDKRLRAELQAAHDRLQSYFNLAPLGVYVADRSGRYVEVNPEACRQSGFTEAELLTMTVAGLVWPPDRGTGIAHFQRVFDAGTAIDDVRFRRKGGGFFWGTVLAGLLPDGRVIAFVEDSTAKTSLQEELRRTNTELEQFAYVVSHDLREPLRMIAGFSALVERRLGPGLADDGREFLGLIRDGARRMDEMLLALLAYSRIGRKGDPATPIPGRELVDEALHFLGPVIAETGAEVTVQEGWPVLWISRNEGVRLFQNLIGNALKYCPPDRPPRVAVSIAPDAGGWLVSVADQGIGVAADEMDRLFQVFQRLHPRDAYEGTGIGLATCRRIVEHYGGRIWMESDGPGRGSTVRFHLPGLRTQEGER